MREKAADNYWLAAACTCATVIAVALEAFLLTFAWGEFEPIMRAVNAAYAVLSAGTLIYLLFLQHQGDSTASRVRLAAITNLLVVLIPIFLLGLAHG